MKRAGLLLAVSATAMLLLMPTAAQAARGPAARPAIAPGMAVAPMLTAGTVYNFYGLVNTAKCLDIQYQSTSTRAPLTHWDCSGLTNQQFVLIDVGPDLGYPTFLIQNVNSLKCLGIRDGTTDVHARVEQDWCDSLLSVRRWIIFTNDDGSVTFCNVASLRALNKWECMDIPSPTPNNTSKVQIYDMNGTNAQRFMPEVRG